MVLVDKIGVHLCDDIHATETTFAPLNVDVLLCCFESSGATLHHLDDENSLQTNSWTCIKLKRNQVMCLCFLFFGKLHLWLNYFFSFLSSVYSFIFDCFYCSVSFFYNFGLLFQYVSFGDKNAQYQPKVEYRIHPSFWNALYLSCCGANSILPIIDFSGLWLTPMVAAVFSATSYLYCKYMAGRQNLIKATQFKQMAHLISNNCSEEKFVQFLANMKIVSVYFFC